MWLTREADHSRAGIARELHGDRADAAGRPRDHDHIAGRDADRAHGCPGCCSDPERAPRGVPGHGGRARRQVLGGDGHELRLAISVPGKADDLIAGVPVVDALTSPLDDTGEFAALPRGKRHGPRS